MHKITVLHIVEAFGGGIYRYFVDLCKVLDSEVRIKNIIIYSDQRKEVDLENIKTDFSTASSLEVVPMSREIHPVKDIKAVFQLKKVIEKYHPDVIHLHSSKAGILGRIAYRLASSKALLYYTPHGFSFLRTDISQTKRNFYFLIEKYAVQVLGGTIIACGDTEEMYAKKLGGETQLIRNGVRIAELDRSKVETTGSKKLTVITLARIAPQRNPAFFNLLALNYPEIDFVWIGDGALRSVLTAKNITITGWITDRDTVLHYLNDSDIYLQTSLWEGLPIAVLEAMFFGKPVIATNVIGNKDAVVHGETGFLIEDEKDFAEAIQKLTNPILRKKMGEAGAKRVREFFNATKNFSALVEWYVSEHEKKSSKRSKQK